MSEPQYTAHHAGSRALTRPGAGYEVNPLFQRMPSAPEPMESPLVQYGRLLNRHKGVLILAATVGLVAGVLWTIPQRPVYKANAVVEIQGLNDEFLNMKNVDPNQQGEYGSETYLQTQMRILRSDSLLERVINQLQVADWPDYQSDAGRIGWLRKKLNMPVPKAVASRDRLLKQVQARLNVQASGLTRIVELSFDDSDPQHAADFVNALAAHFIESSMEARWKTTQQTSQWLNRQLGELRTKLEKSDDELQAYAKANGILLNGEKENVVSAKLQQVQSELSRAQADRISKQTQYELAKSASPEALPEVLGDPSLREFRLKLVDLRRQRAELTSSLTAAHPKVERLQAQITELEETIQRAELNIVGRIRNEFKAAEDRERLVTDAYEKQAQVLADQTSKSIHYNVLKREVESSRALYDTMLARVKEATIATALRTTNIRVVDNARPPSDPYKPSLPLNAGAGLLVGLLGGAGLVLFREQVHHTFRAPGEPGSLLNLPELGAIPAGKSTKESGLVVWEPGARSIIAESFRNSLARILAMMDQAPAPPVLVVTSGSPGEGKSTVSSNLAVALGEVGRKVLLIDGDLRKVSNDVRFTSAPVGATLTGLIKGSEPLDPARLKGMLPESSTPNLYLLPGGHGEESPTALLHSRRLTELLSSLREIFDVIVIDTPPMLYLPDARVFGRHSDGVILVIRAGKTTQEEALRAAQEFGADGTPVLGTILNSWRLSLRNGNVYGAYGLK